MAGPERPDSVYLDTNAWIVWFNDREANPAIRRVMEWTDTGQIQLLVSPLVLVEALGTPLSGAVDEDLQRTLLDLLTSKNVTPVEFDQEVALKARELPLRKIVTPARDAIHLASAIVAAADVLMTWDGKDVPLGQTIEGVYVSEPYLLGDPDLFTGDSQAESGPATR